MNILVTGGTGYLGSHAAVVLMQAGHEVTLLDNFSNSKPQVAERIGRITGAVPRLICADICDRGGLHRLMGKVNPEAVLHFAGLKAVGESVISPLKYHAVNVGGTLNLLEAMQARDIKTLVFSSSATVYGNPDTVPLDETAALRPTNPYGRTKQTVEAILADLCAADPAWRIAALRYFNPAGAHPSGLLGEEPSGTPNNLMPFLAEVAEGLRPELQVFGDDYPTPDGTGVRDYIHVLDLVEGHLAALAYLGKQPGFTCLNLGAGAGSSVLEMVAAFAKASGRPLPYRITGRRPGDVAACWADVRTAERLLGWRASRDIDTICRDAWAWRLERRSQSESAVPAQGLQWAQWAGSATALSVLAFADV